MGYLNGNYPNPQTTISPEVYYHLVQNILYNISMQEKRERCKKNRQERIAIIKDKKKNGLISLKNSNVKDKTRQENARKKSRDKNGHFKSS